MCVVYTWCLGGMYASCSVCGIYMMCVRYVWIVCIVYVWFMYNVGGYMYNICCMCRWDVYVLLRLQTCVRLSQPECALRSAWNGKPFLNSLLYPVSVSSGNGGLSWFCAYQLLNGAPHIPGAPPVPLHRTSKSVCVRHVPSQLELCIW